MPLDASQLLEMYRKMVTIRIFDQRAVGEFHAGNIPGVVHAYIGEEAVWVVIVDEACITGSAAAEITALITEDPATLRALKAPPKRVCAPDVPIPYSPIMERFCLPDKDNVIAGIRAVLG